MDEITQLLIALVAISAFDLMWKLISFFYNDTKHIDK